MRKRPIMHIEIPTADRAVTARFYATLFGWEHGPTGEDVEYTPFEAENMSGGYPNVRGGFRPVTSVLEQGDVVIYVPSEDLETDLAAVVEFGGRVLLTPTPIPNVCDIAIIADPNGTKVALVCGMG